MEWIKVKVRELTPEEQEEYPGQGLIWDMKTPEDGDEILVSDGKSVWTDIWVDYSDGSGFEQTYSDEYEHLWWMLYPKPPSLENDNEQP